MTRKAILLAPLALLIVVAFSSSASATASCRPPRGPGDNLVHSYNLRATNTSCGVARRVVLASPGRGCGMFSRT